MNWIRTKREDNGTWSYFLGDEWIPTQFRTTYQAAAEAARQLAAHQKFLEKSRQGSYLSWRRA